MSSGSVMEGDVVAEFAKNFGVAHFDGKTETLGEFRLQTTKPREHQHTLKL